MGWGTLQLGDAKKHTVRKLGKSTKNKNASKRLEIFWDVIDKPLNKEFTTDTG